MPQTYFESDGKGVDVTLTHEVAYGDPVYVEGWLGIASAGGQSGDMIAVNIDQREYQLQVPESLSVSKGDTIYVTLASVTGNVVPDGAWTTSPDTGRKAFMKATSDKDANNIVTGILLPEGV